MGQLLACDSLSCATGRHQAVKYCSPALSEPAVEPIVKLCQVSVKMLFRDMAVGSSNPVFQPSDDAVDIRKNLHRPVPFPECEGTEVYLLG
jgi:hypothetical protein